MAVLHVNIGSQTSISEIYDLYMQAKCEALSAPFLYTRFHQLNGKPTSPPRQC